MSIARRLALICATILTLTAAACTPGQITAYQHVMANGTPAEQAAATAAVDAWKANPPYETASMGENLPDVSGHWFLACVRSHESINAGLYRAQNPTSTASGAYQYLRSYWQTLSRMAGHGGYPTAASAPPHVQDAVTLYVINNPRQTGGRSHWNGTGC